MRAFFHSRDVVEVETPALSRAANSDPNIEGIDCQLRVPGVKEPLQHFLHTSPEYPMKRLLAAGIGSCYQIARVFRQGERGRFHNPEFTLLEWYRIGMDHHQLMDEVEQLVGEILAGTVALQASERISYGEAFQRYAGVDPHCATQSQLAHILQQHPAVQSLAGGDRQTLLELLFIHCVEPQLGQGRMTFLYDYPATQAALARVRPGKPALAERFELYCNGVELANGYHELSDALEQRRRFQQEQQRREDGGSTTGAVDERLLAALGSGLPDCAGVALGVDRLLMLALGASSIDEVIAFPIERA